MTESRPWLRYYGKVPHRLSYPEITLYDALAATAARVPDAIAWDFLDRTASYRAFLADIDTCANALSTLGLRAGDRILISMPTSAPGVIAFYAANKLGAVAALIHPLSTTPEIEHYLNASGARIAVTLDAFYERFAAARPKAPLETLILARIPDYLSPLKKFGFWLTKGRKIPAVPEDGRVRWWTGLMAGRHPPVARAPAATGDPAAILFSGGTTGLPKGILLSNRNFIAEGMQAAAWGGVGEGDSVLAVLPIFHGFGLGVCVNAVFMAGAKSILVPMFSPKIVAKALRNKRPGFLFGVPTLYDALARDRSLARVDFSCLRGAFSGGDTLPRPVKERFEKLAAARGAGVKLLEGYGLTEAVTAILVMPLAEYREGSIGIPFPDILAKICRSGTSEELPPGEEGEICVSGPPVMIGYLDDPEATNQTLKVHADGRIWLHTGDLGKMDADGFFYFTVRLKRMIKSSGFNVYPAQVEEVLCRHPLVAEACVAGIPDLSQGERVQAFVVLKDPALAHAGTERILIEHCREHLIKWSCPRQVEFCRQMPKTRIGKIDYRVLVQQHVAARQAGGKGIDAT
ncbi:MAG: AMP-binding protein [Acidobacteriia bacterium]|nr:AMP-binding protein [Terriglobia bacterium]